MIECSTREIRIHESVVTQILAENLVCHPSLMRWLTQRTMPTLSVDLTSDATRVEFATVGEEGDPGWDLKAVGDFGQIEIGFVISTRFAYRAAAARKARAAAKALGEKGEAAVALCVWVASQAEIDRMADEPTHYERAVSLESIIAMLDGEARCSAYELQRRREFQIGLLENALRSATASSEAPLAPRETFRRDYLEMIADEAPLLGIEEARDRVDADFSMLCFDVPTLPRWPFLPPVRLAHHLKEGFASILVNDWGEDLDGLASVMEPALESTDYSLALAPSRSPGGKPGVLILVDVPKLDADRPFALQRRDARECVRAIDALRGWFAARKSVVSYWANFIGAAEKGPQGHKRVRSNVSFG